MPDLLDFESSGLGQAQQQVHRVRVTCRIVDSNDQSNVLRDWTQGSQDGPLFYAFNTNVNLTAEARQRLRNAMETFLLRERFEHGDA